MTVTNEITITIYNLSTYLDDAYEKIAIYRANTKDSEYTEITTVDTRLELLPTVTNYYFSDIEATTLNNVYKYKLVKADTTTMSDYITNYFYGNTSDLTEKLRYMIEDITIPERYTQKELRRFISIAVNRLQGTLYRKNFKVDFDGIITPKMSRIDEAIILLQAMIILNQSQQTRSADTNMSFKDGRGTINVRTSDTLKENIKEWKEELKHMIDDINRMYISPILLNMLSTSPYYNQYNSYGGN